MCRHTEYNELLKKYVLPKIHSKQLVRGSKIVIDGKLEEGKTGDWVYEGMKNKQIKMNNGNSYQQVYLYLSRVYPEDESPFKNTYKPKVPTQ